MRAIRIYGYPQANACLVEDAVPPSGEVQIAVQYSALNYKDMLAITGGGKVMRQYPLIAGIDAAGIVQASADARWQKGDAVLVAGAGLGEQVNGGLAQMITVNADSIVPIPSAWTSKTAMLLGTAGFSAALAVDKLLKHGIVPEDGEIAVTGANGAVGLWAVRVLAYLGYDVVASARSPDAHEALFYQAGAQRILSLAEVKDNPKALHSAQFSAAIDTLGGASLAALLSKLQPHGAVCAIGMAEGSAWQGSVMPFILRGVTLYGISSGDCRSGQREQIWSWLAKLFDSDFVAHMPYQEIFLDEVIPVCRDWAKRPAGRIIVNTGSANEFLSL